MVYWSCGRLGRGVVPCADLAEGCAVSTSMGVLNCRERSCVAQALRSTVNWLMARRSVVGAAPQIRRESNHGETGKGDPFWGLNARWLATVNWLQYDGSLEPNHGSFKSWYFPCSGAPKQRPLLDRHTHTRGPYGLENPKD